MRTQMKFTNSDNIEVSVTIVAPIGDIRAFVKKMTSGEVPHYIHDGWPVSTVVSQMREALKAVDRTFESGSDEKRND